MGMETVEWDDLTPEQQAEVKRQRALRELFLALAEEQQTGYEPDMNANAKGGSDA